MEAKSQRSKGRDRTLSSIDVAIEAMNLAKEASSITPAKAVFGTVSVLLAMIRDSMTNKLDFVELGLECAGICRALDRGLNGKKLDELSRSVCDAMDQLTTTVAEIQKKIIKQRGRNATSRLFHAKKDKETIATWKLDLSRVLHVFNTELALNTLVVVSDVQHGVVNTHTMVSDIHRNMIKGQEGNDDQRRLPTQASKPGESPPPPPRVVFGRDELIEKIVGLVENLTPLALIGTGGIGKTSIALTVLHDHRIKQRFDDNRRFIRCDQFPTSLTHFLRQLSRVIGAGVENPENLASLRLSLSSKEMLIILDNAESILDPQGTDAQEIYAAVEELSQLSNICLCITSRISTVPPDCETLDIPTLSVEAARDAFYRIYKSGERPNLVNDVLERLDFHPLSITLLATVAHHSKWDTDRLTREWERQRTGVLQTHHNKSLAATIELSLASPLFQELGPDARGLLGVIAFFPHGVDENNLEWLFPTVPNRTIIFGNFCILSLTYRSNGFVTMLAPLRDHLCPKDPKLSPLLRTTKEHYFDRLSVGVYPGKPGYEEARWIKSEDVNVEHLLNVFTTIDADSSRVWDVCGYFMEHLRWHKTRPVILGQTIGRLPDDHPSKPRCLFELSQLLYLGGRFVECESLLRHALELCRKQEDDFQVARTLRGLSDVNRLLGFFKKGIRQANEASEICERLDDIFEQGQCFRSLAGSLYASNQLNAAEDAASQVIDLFSEIGDQSLVCQCHRTLGGVYYSKGKTEKAINHFEAAFKIASSFGWYDELFWTQYTLARVFLGKDKFHDANVHVQRAKSDTGDVPYRLGRAMWLQAEIWYGQRRFEEAKSEILRAVQVFENLGATRELGGCRDLVCVIEEDIEELSASGELDSNVNAQGTE